MDRCLILWVLPLLLFVIVNLLNQTVAEETDAHSNWDIDWMIMCYHIIKAAAYRQSLVLLSCLHRVRQVHIE